MAAWETVLVVEENLHLLDLIALKLERDNCEVIKKPSGGDAMEILKNGLGIWVVLSDLVMSGKHQGVDVLHKAKSLEPPLPVIMMSGYGDIRTSNQKELKHADRFIEKPLALVQLSGEIEDLITKVSG